MAANSRGEPQERGAPLLEDGGKALSSKIFLISALNKEEDMK